MEDETDPLLVAGSGRVVQEVIMSIAELGTLLLELRSFTTTVLVTLGESMMEPNQLMVIT